MTVPVITATQRGNSASVANYASGKLDSDNGTAAVYVVTLGFVPRYVRFVNLTDRLGYEWFAGCTNPGALKTAANGDRTLETTEGITVGTDGTVSFPAALMVASKSHAWEAMG